MGFLDELKKLTKPYEEDDDFFEDDDAAEAEEDAFISSPRASGRTRSTFEDDDESVVPQRQTAKKDNKVVNIHTTTAVQVVLSKPERFEQAAEIADHLRERRTVVMNLETTNKDVAKRLVDFLSGVAYANDGKIKKVAINTYIITPYNVDIMGDLIDELENNGVYI